MPEINIYALTALMALILIMMYFLGRIELRKISPFELNMYRD
jgi:hypothetical protein